MSWCSVFVSQLLSWFASCFCFAPFLYLQRIWWVCICFCFLHHIFSFAPRSPFCTSFTFVFACVSLQLFPFRCSAFDMSRPIFPICSSFPVAARLTRLGHRIPHSHTHNTKTQRQIGMVKWWDMGADNRTNIRPLNCKGKKRNCHGQEYLCLTYVWLI